MFTSHTVSRGPRYCFYEKLNGFPAQADFGRKVEGMCERFYDLDVSKGVFRFLQVCIFECC